jgi:5-methylcytosine-specific restriction endonuclease McrA
MTLSKNWLRWKHKRAAYPRNWRQISKATIERANHRCEHCGAAHRWFHPITGSVVFLQAAHMDHNPANCVPENLKALCPRCHLTYDGKLHAQRGYMTKRAGRAIEMFPELAA